MFGILGYLATLPLRLALRGVETLARLVARDGDEPDEPRAPAPAPEPARPRSRPDAEPWPGYGSMNANEVIARLREAARAEVAAARRYEQANRRRKTVLAAAERRLKTLGA